MRVLLVLILAFLAFSCDEAQEKPKRESCEYRICEEGRANADTISQVYGIFRSGAEMSYIEVTTGGYTPDTLMISCLVPVLTLPNDGDYIKCSGIIKEVCNSNDPMIQKDSLMLTDIDLVNPIVLSDCSVDFEFGGLDNKKIDRKLKILNMSINKHCLSILVSYTGGCEVKPELTLNIGEDILFGGGFTVEAAIQGLVANDCVDEKIALIKFNLSELGEIVPIREEEYFVLYFQAQDYQRILYPHTYQ